MPQLGMFEEYDTEEYEFIDPEPEKDYRTKAAESMAAILECYLDKTLVGDFLLAYSGGKDSNGTLALKMRAIMALPKHLRTRKIYIVTAQTYLDMTTEVTRKSELKKIQYLIDKEGLPFEIVEVSAPIEKTLQCQYLGKGYVIMRNDSVQRGCTHWLKIEPAEKFRKEHGIALSIVGGRNDESKSREKKIKKMYVSKYFGQVQTNKSEKNPKYKTSFMPVVNFTEKNIWDYIAEVGFPWGDGNDVSEMYKDATGECGMTTRSAGKGETSGACGTRFGCCICTLVAIDKSTQEVSKRKPWFQPYADLHGIILEMYAKTENRSGRMRNGRITKLGGGSLTIKARKELFEYFMIAQRENAIIANLYGVKPQPILTPEMIEVIHKQWEEDLVQRPFLYDVNRTDFLVEEMVEGYDGTQLTINPHYQENKLRGAENESL